MFTISDQFFSSFDWSRNGCTAKEWCGLKAFEGFFTIDVQNLVQRLEGFENGSLIAETLMHYLFMWLQIGRNRCWDEQGQNFETRRKLNSMKLDKIFLNWESVLSVLAFLSV